jgi:oxygen-independent coproporphyrinogen-3 oxidase
LLRELDEGADRTVGRTVTSVFFGGGTPSLMDPATTGALIDRIHQRWKIARDIEITLEANPGTVDSERFKEIRAAGVNRLSMGLQSLDDSQLKFLGRVHDSAQAIKAVELARAIFPRISFDLIYARPGQSLESWRAELNRALAMAADHLSLYQLTIEPGTAFHPMAARGDFIMPDDDHAAALFDLTQEVTGAAGLPAYEISNHARPGAECRHNLLYWQGDDFLGIGPGAHGRLTDETGRTTTYRRHRAPEIWRGLVKEKGDGTAESGLLSPDDRIIELVMMGLRLTQGLKLANFPGLEAALDPTGLAEMIEHGFLEKKDSFLRATDKGRLLLNRVIERVLPFE